MALKNSAPSVILVRPQLGENIGAVARAMHNFGLTDLRLVAPKNGWPNGRAWDMATNATGILDKATLFATVAGALCDIHFALATTARPRDMEKPVFSAREAAAKLQRQGKRTAVLFGPERTGLTNEDAILCDGLITIPTEAENPSLNLAQAAVIVGYEWCMASQAKAVRRAENPCPAASKAEIEGFFAQMEEYLDAVNHFRTPGKKPLMWQNLRNIFTRSAMNTQEVKTLRGVVRALYLRRKG